MQQQKLLVTMKELQRYKIITEVLEKRLQATEASRILSLSYRQTLRLKDKVGRVGLEGLLRKPPPSPPNEKITHSMIDEIIRLRKEIYYDFNIMHFKDKLDEVHKTHLSYESIRKILIQAKEHQPKKKRKIHRQRRRMPQAGLLEQMDSSQHRWLEHIPQMWWLIAIVDDASNEVPYARFFPKDTLFANMHVLRCFIEMKGIFTSLYVDKASHFKTTRHGGLHYNVAQEQEETQIERALGELGINIIPANSPQAKGRIEVTFRLFQDRLIKEMRLAGVKDYDEANKFLLQRFLPWYNAKYARQADSAYMSIPKDKNLDFIFCIKKERTVGLDNTVQIYGQVIQIPPSKIKRTFAKSKVDVCLFEDNRIFVLYKGSVVAESRLSENNRVIQKEKKIEKLLNKREYMFILARPKSKRTGCKPAENHPWRTLKLKNSKFVKKLNVTFQRSKNVTS